jgi:hypothetical protein
MEDELKTKKSESGQQNGYCEEVVMEPQLDLSED